MSKQGYVQFFVRFLFAHEMQNIQCNSIFCCCSFFRNKYYANQNYSSHKKMLLIDMQYVCMLDVYSSHKTNSTLYNGTKIIIKLYLYFFKSRFKAYIQFSCLANKKKHTKNIVKTQRLLNKVFGHILLECTHNLSHT